MEIKGNYAIVLVCVCDFSFPSVVEYQPQPNGDVLYFHMCSFFCLFVCISATLRTGRTKRKGQSVTFEDVTFNTLDTEFFPGNPLLLSISWKNDKWIVMTFSGGVECQIKKNNLHYLRMLRFTRGCKIFLLFGSVFLSIGGWMNFHMSDMIREIIRYIFSQLTRLCDAPQTRRHTGLRSRSASRFLPNYNTVN